MQAWDSMSESQEWRQKCGMWMWSADHGKLFGVTRWFSVLRPHLPPYPISSEDKVIIYLDLQPWRHSNASTNFLLVTFAQLIASLCLLGNKHDISDLFAKQRKPIREGTLEQNDRWFNHLALDRLMYSPKIWLSLKYMFWWNKLFRESKG